MSLVGMEWSWFAGDIMSSHIPRIWLAQTLDEGETVILSDSDRLHHLRDVLRLKRGEAVTLFNSTSGEYTASITDVGRSAITFAMGSRQRTAAPLVARHILFAPLKRQATEWLIEKTTELGATHLHPILTDHTQVRSVNAQRLQAIAVDAVEQSGQFHIPQIMAPTTIAAALRQLGGTPVFAAIEPQRDSALPHLHTVAPRQPVATAVIIGPEGGFSTPETELLRKQSGVTAVSLGSQVLRAETAAILACGILGLYTAGNE